jgi:hypothetical protein
MACDMRASRKLVLMNYNRVLRRGVFHPVLADLFKMARSLKLQVCCALRIVCGAVESTEVGGCCENFKGRVNR